MAPVSGKGGSKAIEPRITSHEEQKESGTTTEAAGLSGLRTGYELVSVEFVDATRFDLLFRPTESPQRALPSVRAWGASTVEGVHGTLIEVVGTDRSHDDGLIAEFRGARILSRSSDGDVEVNLNVLGAIETYKLNIEAARQMGFLDARGERDVTPEEYDGRTIVLLKSPQGPASPPEPEDVVRFENPAVEDRYQEWSSEIGNVDHYLYNLEPGTFHTSRDLYLDSREVEEQDGYTNRVKILRAASDRLGAIEEAQEQRFSREELEDRIAQHEDDALNAISRGDEESAFRARIKADGLRTLLED